MIFPICLPYHPIFGERNCEVYLLYSHNDAFRFSYEKVVFLPVNSESTFTDIYTHRAFYEVLNPQTVGFNFSSKNLVGSAYTERILSENYGFGFSGRYRWFSAEVLKGRRGKKEEKAYFLSFSEKIFSLTGGWDGGLSLGASVGGNVFLRGAYYYSLDTILILGLGFKRENLKAYVMGGKGIVGELSLKFMDFRLIGSYNKTSKLNSSVITIIYGEILGISVVNGMRLWNKEVNSPEFQGKLSIRNPIFSVHAAGAVILNDRIYRLSGGAILNFLRYKDAVEFYPKFEAYYEDNGRLWINVGIDAVFYRDLKIGVSYDRWEKSGFRVEVSWRLWD